MLRDHPTADLVGFSRLPTPHERGERAAAVVRLAGGSAMDAALESISVAFDAYSDHYRLKQTVRSCIRRGPTDVGNRTRFRFLLVEIEESRVDMHRACRVVDALYRRDRVKRPHLRASAHAQLRLWLRWLRRYHADRWPEFIAEIVRPGWMPSLYVVGE